MMNHLREVQAAAPAMLSRKLVHTDALDWAILRIAELEAALEEAKTIIADDRTLHSACAPRGCYMGEHIAKFDELIAALATGPAPEQPVD